MCVEEAHMAILQSIHFCENLRSRVSGMGGDSGDSLFEKKKGFCFENKF